METTDPVIRLLTTDDLDAASGLSAEAGWTQRLADQRMRLRTMRAELTVIGGRIAFDRS